MSGSMLDHDTLQKAAGDYAAAASHYALVAKHLIEAASASIEEELTAYVDVSLQAEDRYVAARAAALESIKAAATSAHAASKELASGFNLDET